MLLTASITKIIRNVFSLLIFFIFSTSLIAQDVDQIKLAEEYYREGDVDKAIDIYSDLAKTDKNIPVIHKNYFELLLSTESYKEAEKYLKKVLKANPDNLTYQIDRGILYQRQGDAKDANKIFSQIIEKVKKDQNKCRIVAQAFVNNQLPEMAIEVYKESRKALGNPYLFALEMAYVYRMMDKTDLVIQEYLNFSDQNPENLSYVKNSLQNFLTKEEDLLSLENLLIGKIQAEPDKHIYNELLIWVNLQQKNFYGAFIQAKAVDKRFSTQGRKVMEIGRIALENNDFENAIKIFTYIIKEYPHTNHYILAKRFLIKSREELVKNSYTVKREDIEQLIQEYDSFVKQVGFNQTTLEAQRSKALLYAFYLDEKNRAVEILNSIIENPRSNATLRANAKLDLGDIYILTNMPWESTLLYSQVEKTHKDDPIGYEAKLRNAKLSYYKGDFELALDHLNILKQATTREIANDAMALSLLIKDNTVLDSSDHAMKKYAHIELLLFQNKKTKALKELDEMLVEFSGHSLVDEIYFQKAKIYRETGKYEKALEALEFINQYYQDDILGDDAYFLTAVIYEENVQDKEKAMEYYQNFLTRHRGSVYVAEARKRFRKLRGDFL